MLTTKLRQHCRDASGICLHILLTSTSLKLQCFQRKKPSGDLLDMEIVETSIDTDLLYFEVLRCRN